MSNPSNAAYAAASNFDSTYISNEESGVKQADNVYFPSMDAHDELEFAKVGSGRSASYNGVNNGLASSALLSQSFGNDTTDWESFLNDFTIDAIVEDPGSFNTSVLSTSPGLSASVHHTPDTQDSGGCATINIPGEGVNDTTAAPEASIETNSPIEGTQQPVASAVLGPDGDDSAQHIASPGPYLATAANQAAMMAAGANVYTAASLGIPPSEPVLAMTTSPRHRVFRMPTDIGPGGETRYLEPHEIAQYANLDAAKPNIILPPDLEKHMYYLPGQHPSQQRQQLQQHQQVAQQGPPQQMNQPMLLPQGQNVPVFRQAYNQRRPQQTQRVPQIQQPWQQVGVRPLPNQRVQGHNVPLMQHPQHPQRPQHPVHLIQSPHPQHSQHQQSMTSPQQLPQQHFFPQHQIFQSVNNFQTGMQVPRSTQVRQSMHPNAGQVNTKEYQGTQNQNLELWYTADGYQSSNRAERPPNMNSHEWARNKDYRSTWNVGDIYTDWLNPGSNIIEPHIKNVMKKDIKLGMSSQDAVKAAITDAFVRGAAWAAKTILTKMEKEIKEEGTMLGFRAHKKVKKFEMDQAMVEQIVKTSTPSIHGAQCANVLAWAYDEFYPGVFCQEGSNGKPRNPQEIFQAWNNLRGTVSKDQLNPVLFDTSTGVTVMTDIKPDRPPVAHVRSFAVPCGHQPAIKIAQFPGMNINNPQATPTGGQSFFTNPEVPATMAMQQMRRTDSTVPNPKPRSQGGRMPPKTAEEKKETRNRKADEKIGWTLLGQSRKIDVDGVQVTSYLCSDRESRILDGQRLEEAKERTANMQRKQRGAKAMADAAGLSVHITTTNEVPAVVQTGTEMKSASQIPTPTNHMPPLQTTSPITNMNAAQPTSNGELKKRRAPDEASMPSGRKRSRKGAQQGPAELDSSQDILFYPTPGPARND
ncbi:hypothetical protein PWT90_00048 [Aphanocladium album]|nr:hypothetical protein PWT90_00048 [Aphanocladium album]